MAKRLIQKLLKLTGWKLSKIKPVPPSGMAVGLKWFQENGIEIGSVVDVGASDGQWTQECLEFFPDAAYLLFEPHPIHSRNLDAFVSKHARMIADKRAVGSRDGKVLFDTSDIYGGGMDPDGLIEGSMEVPQVTLDTAIREHNLVYPCLIKLDTHGFEKEILDGAIETLTKHTNALVVECYNYRIQPNALLFWEFCSYLGEKGFRPVNIVDVLRRRVDQSLWQMDIFFVRETWKGFENLEFQEKE